MILADNGIFVAESEGYGFVEVVGRASYQNSHPLRLAAQQWMRNGSSELFVNLNRCQAMDSTFLGMLAGFALGLQERTPPGHLHLVNVSERHLQSLQMLGIDRLANVASGEPEMFQGRKPADAAFQKLPGTDLSSPMQRLDSRSAAEMMLECHEDLCRADERNEARFKDVKELLKEDIARKDSSKP
jgi:anti-sigma B factor antagonist